MRQRPGIVEAIRYLWHYVPWVVLGWVMLAAVVLVVRRLFKAM